MKNTFKRNLIFGTVEGPHPLAHTTFLLASPFL